jgi:acetyltransferase AlgX (SGNH hydrolase-like protein)
MGQSRFAMGLLRRLLARLALVIAGAAIGVLLLEGGVRVFDVHAVTAYTGRGLYAPDDDLGHVLRAGLASGDVRTNSWGLRDREYPLEKPPGTFRIVGIGDSFTFGSTSPRGIYLEVLEEMLAAGGGTVEVINTGVPSYSTHQEIGHLKKIGLRFAPDLVILGLFPTGDVGENHSNEHLEVVDGELAEAVGKWERRLRWWRLYRFVRGRLVVHAAAPAAEKAYLQIEHDRLQVCRPDLRRHLVHGYDVTERLLLELRDLLRGRGIGLLVLLIPDEVQVDGELFARLLRDHGERAETYDLEYPNRRLGDFMRRHQIDFVDPLPELRARAREERVYWPNDTHWNEAGNRIAALALAQALRPRVYSQDRK